MLSKEESVRLLNSVLLSDIISWNEARQEDIDWVPDLIRSDLSMAQLIVPHTGVNLRKANLTEANLSNAVLNGANLINANLRGATLRGALLDGANLSGADLSKADLSGAYLSGVNLYEANLTEANLENINIADAFRGSKTNFSKAIILNTRFTYESTPISLFELACMESLPRANFKSPTGLTDYLSRVFEFPHHAELEKEIFPEIMNTTIKRITAIQQLYQNEPPDIVIGEIQLITAEVLAYLKRNPTKIYEIGSRQFEVLIAEILSSFGWRVQLTPKSKDGGYDLFAISKTVSSIETSWLIECKRYRDGRPIGIEIARALYGVKADLHVANAILATTSYFTKGVKDFKASRYDFQLVDYEGILEWINEYKPHPDGRWYIDENSRLVLPK